LGVFAVESGVVFGVETGVVGGVSSAIGVFSYLSIQPTDGCG
jgi:siroheme synthase